MKEVTNINQLAPTKFSLVMDKFPNITWFAQRAVFPGVSVSPPQVFTNQKVDYWVLGDKLIFEDLIIGFVMDESLNTVSEFFEWIKENVSKGVPAFSDVTLNILSNNSQSNIQVIFRNCFPYMMGSVFFDTTQEELSVLTNDVYFKFSHYDIIKPA